MSARRIWSLNSAKQLSSLFFVQKKVTTSQQTKYEILGVCRGASSREVERAYQEHLKENHYSRGNEMTLQSIAKHRQRRNAYYVLRHDVLRESYDDFLDNGSPGDLEYDFLAIPLEQTLTEDKEKFFDDQALNQLKEKIKYDFDRTSFRLSLLVSAAAVLPVHNLLLQADIFTSYIC